MFIKNLALLTAAGMMLSACFESERSCYERLEADFDSSLEFSEGSCLNSSSPRSCNEYGMIALRSSIRLFSILMDDDQDACDYISDGARLVYRP